MYTIEDIKAYEEAGFSRRQAEMQVKIVTTFKHEFRITMKELSDKLDANFKAIDRRFDLQDQKFEMLSKHLTTQDNKLDAQDRRFDAQDRKMDGHDKKLDAQDRRFDAQDRKMDAQDRKIDAIPFKTAVYLVAVLLSFISLLAIVPTVKTWLEYLLVK